MSFETTYNLLGFFDGSMRLSNGGFPWFAIQFRDLV
jgi:hypothetical protein